MKIAYLANSDNLSHIADRRRFAHYAKKEDVVFFIEGLDSALLTFKEALPSC